MAIGSKHEVRQELRHLQQAVDEAPDENSAMLADIHSILARASAAVQALRSQSPSGAYEIPISPERMRVYFPVTRSSRREVMPEETREADASWDAALERGRSHREEAFERLGPMLTPRQVAERLGTSTVTVNNWRRRSKLLALRFDDHQYLYPASQFSTSPEQGEQGVLRHFAEILALLPTASPWAKAGFFLTKAPFLGGRTPLEMLRSGTPEDVERVRLLAPRMGELGS